MMTSKNDSEAFVWIWLPGETQPVVAGKLESDGDAFHFNYGKSYLERTRAASPAIPIYEPELPLRPGILLPPDGLPMAGSIRDAAPDAWGRRVILNSFSGDMIYNRTDNGGGNGLRLKNSEREDRMQGFAGTTMVCNEGGFTEQRYIIENTPSGSSTDEKGIRCKTGTGPPL